MDALKKYVSGKDKGSSDMGPESEPGGDAFEMAVDELMAALKSGDKAAVGDALRAAVMECSYEE